MLCFDRGEALLKTQHVFFLADSSWRMKWQRFDYFCGGSLGEQGNVRCVHGPTCI
jgi:hypothetical protein